MAQTVYGRGDPAKAPMSVAAQGEPKGEDFNNLVSFIGTKGAVTLRSRAKKNILGHGPGDDLNEQARTLNPPPGAIIRAVSSPDAAAPQNARHLAYLVAAGYADIVEDSEFSGAPTHADVWDDHNRERSARELARMETPAAGTVLDVLTQQVAALTQQVAILSGADAGKAPAKK